MTCKSTGHDNLRSTFIKFIGDTMAKPLSIIINKSLSTGITPAFFKIDRLVPEYKNGNNQEFKTYHTIYLIPVLSKMLENVVHKRHFFERK